MKRAGFLVVGFAALGCASALAEPAHGDAACAHKGPRFVQVPGTATCVKIAGRAVAEADTSTGAHRARTRSRAGAFVSMDARTDTELGPLRSFVRVRTGQGQRER